LTMPHSDNRQGDPGRDSPFHAIALHGFTPSETP
jgi:hypothetical protein